MPRQISTEMMLFEGMRRTGDCYGHIGSNISIKEEVKVKYMILLDYVKKRFDEMFSSARVSREWQKNDLEEVGWNGSLSRELSNSQYDEWHLCHSICKF